LFSTKPTTKVRKLQQKHSLSQLCQEFFLYDFEANGFVKLDKAKLVMTLLFKPDELDIDLEDYQPCRQTGGLIDVNIKGNE
jgi:hypothetical protein